MIGSSDNNKQTYCAFFCMLVLRLVMTSTLYVPGPGVRPESFNVNLEDVWPKGLFFKPLILRKGNV